MMKIFKRLKNRKGTSIVELLMVFGLAAIIIPAILMGIMATREGKAQDDQRVQAISILRNAQEAVRSISQRDWLAFAVNGDFHPTVSGNAWVLSSGPITEDGYTTTVTVSDVYRDVSGAIVTTGGTLDPATKKVVVTVSWTTPFNSEVNTTSYLSRYRNQVYTETTVADFTGGTISNMQITNDSGGELKLSNNNKAKWCSPAFSAATIDLPDGPPVAVAATASAASINIPNDAYVVVSPLTTNSIKMAHINVTANVATPTASLRGKFTLNSSEYSNVSYVPSSIGITNSFKTTDVRYYRAASGNTYALIGTDLPDKEVIAVWVNDNDPSNDNSTAGEFQDPVNKIYKYKTFFNTKIYSTSFNSPSANAAETSSAGDNNGYGTSPTNAYASDGSYAVDSNSGSNTGTSCTGTDKDKHRYYNYGFSIPTGATINGIEIALTGRADSSSNSPTFCVQLSWDGGTTWTTAKSTATLSTTNTTYTLGGAADTWGRAWSDTNFSNANFRVRIINVSSSTSRDFSLDWIGAKIHYNGISTALNDQAPFGYGASSINVLENTGYVASGGYLYSFDLSNIDSKSSTSGLDQVGCRIELDGFDCQPGSPALQRKYSAGETGTSWSTNGNPASNACSDGGNIELYADNDVYPVKVGTSNYIFVAVGAGTDPELNIVNATSVPDSGSSPSINSNTCGTIASGNSGWKRVSSLDFNSRSGTQEAANSVYAKSDGTRAYISSNGAIDANGDDIPDSKQFYIINTTNKSSPAFLAGVPGSPSYGPTSGFYYGTSPNDQLHPKRSLTVLNGDRVVLVGTDTTSDGFDAQEYQVLNSETEATPTYCAGLNFDQGFNDLTSVTEADSDNYVYMVANTNLNELKIIEGGPDNALYVSSGTFESKTFDSSSENMFNRFFATSSVPAQTTLTYQIAVADPVSGSCTGATYNFVGPDGTENTFFSSASELPKNSDGSGFENPGRCMRYKVYMSSVNQQQTPVMNDFGVNYSY